MNQAIRDPLGVTVFGSHVLRVDPDFAVVRVEIHRTAAQPADALAQARDASARVRRFLREDGLDERDVQSTRTALRTLMDHRASPATLIGHQAAIGFQVVVRALDAVERVLTGMVEAGADTVESVTYQTERLRQLRAEARARAVEAARRKADNYAKAASASLGKVLHIEDLDPSHVQRRGYGHAADTDLTAELEDGPKAYDPGAIRVAGAVGVTFALIT